MLLIAGLVKREDGTILYMGGMFWNDLPKHIQDINSKTVFKSAIMDLI